MASDDPTEKNRRYWDRIADDYQSTHDPQLARHPLAWGVWAIPESELRVLGDVSGRDVLEFGCGAARWSLALADLGARAVGMDLSAKQLAHAREFRGESGAAVALVRANAERTPFADASFDIVFCDHGATTFARPEHSVAEAARLLRPGGLFAFHISSPFHALCWDDATDEITPHLARDYFDLTRLEDEDQICHQLPYGEWIRLFSRHGLVVEDLIEIQPPADARTTYTDFVPLDWARRWPAENLWRLRKGARRDGV